jgi:hypothetical protein
MFNFVCVPVLVPDGYKLVPDPDESVRPGKQPMQPQLVLRQPNEAHAAPASAPHPEACRKIFVGGLSPLTTQERLLEYFASFGAVCDCKVVNDATTKKSRGFGFVEFEHGIPPGLLEQSHFIDQRRCAVKPYSYNSPN